MRRCSDGLLVDMVGIGSLREAVGGLLLALCLGLFLTCLGGECEHVRRGSDDLRWAPFERGPVRRQGCERSCPGLFWPCVGAYPSPVWMLPEGWEQVRRCSDRLLVDMVGLEGNVARGRVKASFAPVGTSSRRKRSTAEHAYCSLNRVALR